MSSTKTSALFSVRFVVGLVGVIGLIGWGVWLLSSPALQASGGDPSPSTFVSPIGNPRLSLSKRVDNSHPAPGEQIIYTLSYSNANPGSRAFDVHLYDFLPAGAQFLSANPPVTPLPDGVLLFTTPYTLGPGTENHAVTIRVRVLEGYSQLHNYALIAAQGVTPTYASLLTSVEPLPGQLRLTKTGDSFVLVNSQLIYTLRCENVGTAPATDVTLADVLPAGLTFLDAWPAPEVAMPPLLRWSLGDLAPGASRSVVLTTSSPALAGVITNTALVDARQAPMTTTLFSTQVVTQGAVLQVAKEGSASSVQVGGTLVYTIRYSNDGNLSATGVVLTDTLPVSITIRAISPTPNSLTTQYAVWQLGALAAKSAEERIVITATVWGPVSGTLHNVVDITGRPISFPGHAELDTDVQPATLYLPIITKS